MREVAMTMCYEGYCIGGPRHGEVIAGDKPILVDYLLGQLHESFWTPHPARVDVVTYRWAIYYRVRDGDEFTLGYWRFDQMNQADADLALETVSEQLREWLVPA